MTTPGVLVTAFGPNPDGAGTVLRLWEHAGRAGICGVRLPEGMQMRRAKPVDLRGQSLGAPTLVGTRAFNVRLDAFSPSSFVLTD